MVHKKYYELENFIVARGGDVHKEFETPPCDLAPGARAGQYLITGFIAHGGGGSVYSARHGATGSVAAVKILHRSLASLPKMVERFRREIQALNLLRHPSIVRVWEVGTLPDGWPFYAMEYLPGRTVSK